MATLREPWVWKMACGFLLPWVVGVSFIGYMAYRIYKIFLWGEMADE
jgi:hypothetical protein